MEYIQIVRLLYFVFTKNDGQVVMFNKILDYGTLYLLRTIVINLAVT